MKTASEVAEEICNDCNHQQDGACKGCITQALTAYAEEHGKVEREKGFHEGKEFAILTIGNAITSEEGSKSPFLAYSIAIRDMR